MTHPPSPPDAYMETAPAKPVPATPSNVAMTSTKAHASAAGAGAGSVLGIAIAGLVVKLLGPEWADQELAIGTIITAALSALVGWGATYWAPRNQPKI